jgi:hypothetical protein
LVNLGGIDGVAAVVAGAVPQIVIFCISKIG